MKLAICDDDVIFANDLRTMCLSYPSVENVTVAPSALDLFNMIENGILPDAILMDIDFGNSKNGIDYSNELYSLYPNLRIIYITSYVDQYVQQVFFGSPNLFGFITKPVQKNILLATLQKLQRALDEDKSKTFKITKNGNVLLIPADTILYLESKAHIVYIHTSSEVHSIYDRLNLVINRLPSSFLHCHKSYIVNMKHISLIESNRIVLSAGQSIPISKSRTHITKETYFSYIQKKL